MSEQSPGEQGANSHGGDPIPTGGEFTDPERRIAILGVGASAIGITGVGRLAEMVGPVEARRILDTTRKRRNDLYDRYLRQYGPDIQSDDAF